MDQRFSELLLSRVEDAGLNASAPPQQRWLDGWLVRLSPGKAKRARCVNAVAEGRLPLDDKLAQARAACAEAGLPLIVRITPFSCPPGLDEVLAKAGFRQLDDTRVMVNAELGAQPVPGDLPPGMALRALPAAEFAEAVGALRGSPAGQRAAHAQRLALSPVPYRGFALEVDGQLVACGQFAMEGDLVGLYDVFTSAASRGRGHASMLCAALLDRARRQGARVGYLQVESDNAPARAIYRRLGFADAYAYHYRTDDPAAS
jgi:ribosomal protein S18 acetylase RimI-like enzyme